MDVHEVLVKARNHIDRSGWAQNRSDGWWWEREQFQSQCAHNAVCKVTPARDQLWARHGAIYALLQAAGLRHRGELYEWNDAPERTKAEVLALYDRAIAATAPQPQDPLAGKVVVAQRSDGLVLSR